MIVNIDCHSPNWEIRHSLQTWENPRWEAAIGDRPITRAELRRNTGERGTRCYVAQGGVVYDVTDCPKWRTGLHEQLHFAGQDLTGEIAEAPHTLEVFQRPCVHRIGPLVDV